MASFGSVFSDTLRSITTTKLTELSKKRTVFEEQKASLLVAVQLELDQKARVQKLLDGVKQCFSVATDSNGRIISGSTEDKGLELKLKNLDRVLQQANHDLSISSKLLQDREQALIQQLNAQTLKYQYATLYGELVNEWLSTEKGRVVSRDYVLVDAEDSEQAAEKEKHEQRLQWESSVFHAFETDTDAIELFLQTLFNEELNKQGFEGLKQLRESVEAFEQSLATPNQFDESVLSWTIQGLLSSELLTDEKRSLLKDFLNNSVVLREVSDVLNMRMTALQTWGWEGDISIDQRRHVNGKYRVYMHEDLLQAIFLQFIGVKWSVFFKRAFLSFARFDGAWTSLRKAIPKSDRMRREYYLGKQKLKPSVHSKRQSLYMSRYFVSKLLDSETQTISALEGEEEALQLSLGLVVCSATHDDADGRRRSRRERNDEDEEDAQYEMEHVSNKSKNPMEEKQFLLHLLSTEILLNTQLHGEFTCVHSEFENWAQNLPHSTISCILSFFGVSPKWLSFFVKFLQAPLKFVQDEASVQSQIRRRGVPESHVLSDVFGEVVLFCVDYSVNQATEGGQLYRTENDLWFWSSSHEACIKAWTAVQRFSEIMGLPLNAAKTGCERILQDKEDLPIIDSALPDGEIRWGFLYLDSAAGKFVIDQSMVDTHIQELRRQLQDKTKSVFSWVQAWNAYADTFFTTNFGKPANCYGQQHVDMLLQTFERIQRSLFPNDGGVAQYLKTTIHDRFGIADSPDGYIYFPTDLGGLELHSPFIPLLLIRDSITRDPASKIATDFMAAETNAYRRAKTDWENKTLPSPSHRSADSHYAPSDSETFLSFAEFSRYREEFDAGFEGNLYQVYSELLQQPEEESVEIGAYEGVALENLHATSGIHSRWYHMTPYWKWIVGLYGGDMVERFGGLAVVDRGLLPIGMVGLVRSGRVRW